jgi:hypothetical protein
MKSSVQLLLEVFLATSIPFGILFGLLFPIGLAVTFAAAGTPLSFGPLLATGLSLALVLSTTLLDFGSSLRVMDALVGRLLAHLGGEPVGTSAQADRVQAPGPVTGEWGA